MIVGFTGTQHGLTLAQRTALRKHLESLRDVQEFHHGDCIGADATAHNIMQRRTDVIIHPSDRKDKRAYCKGALRILQPKPPLDRNKDIVAAIDDTGQLVACPKAMHEEQRSGTWATTREAFRKRKNVVVVWPDGRIQAVTSYLELE